MAEERTQLDESTPLPPSTLEGIVISDKEAAKIPNAAKLRQNRYNNLSEEQKAAVDKANAAGQNVQMTTMDGHIYTFMAPDQKAAVPAQKPVQKSKANTPAQKEQAAKEALANANQEAKQPQKEEEKKKGSWWERNKEWILWTLGGLALGGVLIAGFRKGGWWNKRKSNSNPASVSNTPGGNTNPGGGNENPGGGNENPGGGNENPGGGNENPGGGNENPGGGNENPGGGNENPGGGNTDNDQHFDLGDAPHFPTSGGDGNANDVGDKESSLGGWKPNQNQGTTNQGTTNQGSSNSGGTQLKDLLAQNSGGTVNTGNDGNTGNSSSLGSFNTGGWNAR